MKYLVSQKAGLYRECEAGETARAVFLSNGEYSFYTACTPLAKGIVKCKHITRVSKEEEKEIKKEIQEIEARIETLRAEVEEKAEAMHDLDDEVCEARANNENLLRMIKEKLNQARNLRPKKSHPGYVLTRQDEETITIGYDGNGNPIYQHGWRTTFETPYNIDIPIELIENVVVDDLSHALRGNIEIYKGRYMDVPESVRAGNVIYNYDFHANINDKNHLWTICLHSPYQIEIKDGKKEVEDEDGKEEVEDGVEEVEDGKEEIEDGKEDE